MIRESLKLNIKTCNAILKMRQNLSKGHKNRYDYDEDLLKKHLTPFLKKHDLSSAYFKATLINSFYSTRMGADTLFEVAKKIKANSNLIQHILRKRNIRGKENEINKFLEECKIKQGNRYIRPYSFLTKYIAIHDRLAHHNGARFPIYDQFISKYLSKIKNFGDKELNISQKKLKTYTELYNSIDSLAEEFSHNFTAIDNVLWTIGKYLQNKSIKTFNNEAKNLKTLIRKMKKKLQS